MARHWVILGVLTLARTAMGFQFQSIPAAAPQLIGEVGLSYAALGTLIGLYLLPGAAVALPGGWLGTRFGDKRVALVGLGLMAAGGALTGLSAVVPVIFAGRLLAGTGGVLLNVLLTKMVADWFARRDTVTAMGILIVSWPLGVSLALVLLPGLAAALGWQAAMLAAAAVPALCLALVWAVYEAPPEVEDRPGAERRAGGVNRDVAPDVAGTAPARRLTRRETALILLSGLVWTCYNVGLFTFLAFAPDYLAALGRDPVAAAAAVSVAGWLIMPGLAGGGWIARRIGRPDGTVIACLAAVALLIWLVPATGGPLLLLAAIGLVFGPPAALILVLPVEVLRPAVRGIGMGVYFTCYYLGMALLVPAAGVARDISGHAAAPVWFSGAMLVLGLAALLAFRAVQRRTAPATG